ncbi:MAG: hypothetical protein MZV70_73580 [Desulfobacterales bacterium]|nr:hypothetical protein [Desulfobacterales bacterium]
MWLLRPTHTAAEKVGHTGTLTPFATGVLPVALGDATKIILYLDEFVKEYRATMRLGISTEQSGPHRQNRSAKR